MEKTRWDPLSTKDQPNQLLMIMIFDLTVQAILKLNYLLNFKQKIKGIVLVNCNIRSVGPQDKAKPEF